MQKIEDLVKVLESRRGALFHVKDKMTGRYLKGLPIAARDINQEYLNRNHNGDISEYFNALKELGVETIIVVPRASNGTKTGQDVYLSPPFDVILNPAGTGTRNMTTPPTAAAPETTQQIPAGLGFADQVKAFSDSSNLSKSEAELKDLKVKYEAIKAEKEALKDKHTEFKIAANTTELEIKRLKKRLKKSKKSGGLVKTVQGLAGSPDSIGQILAIAGPIVQMIKGTGAMPLKVDEDQADTLTDWQKAIVKAVEGWPEEALTELYSFIKKYGENAPGFKDQVSMLLSDQHAA